MSPADAAASGPPPRDAFVAEPNRGGAHLLQIAAEPLRATRECAICRSCAAATIPGVDEQRVDEWGGGSGPAGGLTRLSDGGDRRQLAGAARRTSSRTFCSTSAVTSSTANDTGHRGPSSSCAVSSKLTVP